MKFSPYILPACLLFTLPSCEHKVPENTPGQENAKEHVETTPKKDLKKKTTEKPPVPTKKELPPPPSPEDWKKISENKDTAREKDAPAEGVVKEGIRFVFRDSLDKTPENLFFLMKEGVSFRVDKRRGIPSMRIPFPAGKTVKIYKGDPVKNKETATLWATAQIPENSGKKTLGIIATGEEGISVQFIDETDFLLGDVIIQNLTPQDLSLTVSSPDNKQVIETIDLPAGSVKKFAPGRNAPGSDKKNIYPTTISRQDNQGRWYVMRATSLEVPYYSSEIVTFTWNEKTRMPERNKISLRQEGTPST